MPRFGCTREVRDPRTGVLEPSRDNPRIALPANRCSNERSTGGKSGPFWTRCTSASVLTGHNELMPWSSRPTPADDAARSPVVRGPHDAPFLSDEELIVQRTRWFEAYTSQRNVFADPSGGPYSCPCCGHLTLGERGGYEICSECGWEDDGQDDHDAKVIRGGPNGRHSLADARTAYVSEGGIPLPHQPPTDPA